MSGLTTLLVPSRWIRSPLQAASRRELTTGFPAFPRRRTRATEHRAVFIPALWLNRVNPCFSAAAAAQGLQTQQGHRPSAQAVTDIPSNPGITITARPRRARMLLKPSCYVQPCLSVLSIHDQSCRPSCTPKDRILNFDCDGGYQVGLFEHAGMYLLRILAMID